jgi:hypothetical protein
MDILPLCLTPFTLEDLIEWLSVSKSRLRNGVAQPFSVIDQEFNILYSAIQSFVEYSKHREASAIAAIELKVCNTNENTELIDWCWKYEELGNEMFGFAMHYLWWDGTEYQDRVRVYDNIYCEREPFIDLILISKIFELIVVDGEERLDLNEENLDKIRVIL